MTEGVVYSIHGQSYWPQITASFHSLRKVHPDVLVCFVALDLNGFEIGLRLAQDKNTTVLRPHSIKVGTKNSGYAAKPRVIQECPFDRGVFLDADTLVALPFFGDLVPRGKEQAVLTQFASWTTAGKKISGRVKRWGHVAPEEVRQSLVTDYPAINTGVFGFIQNSPYFQTDWHEMTQRNVSFICDEIAAQLLVPGRLERGEVRVASSAYNCSPIYATKSNDPPTIYHFHGGKHLRESVKELWLPTMRECFKANTGRCREWLQSVAPEVMAQL